MDYSYTKRLLILPGDSPVKAQLQQIIREDSEAKDKFSQLTDGYDDGRNQDRSKPKVVKNETKIQRLDIEKVKNEQVKNGP